MIADFSPLTWIAILIASIIVLFNSLISVFRWVLKLLKGGRR